jgi:pimeloyl-ACP methyl ester carboxylesterase
MLNNQTSQSTPKDQKKEVLIPKRLSRGGTLSAVVFQLNSSLTSDKKPPVVIMCHGFPGDKNDNGNFGNFAKKLLAVGIETITFDFSGYAANPREEITLQKQIMDLEDVWTWAKTKGYETLGTLGLSLGGVTSLWAELPERKAAFFMAPAIYLNRNVTFILLLLFTVRKIFTKKPMRFPFSGYRPQILVGSGIVEDAFRFYGKRRKIKLNSFTIPTKIVHGTGDWTVRSWGSKKAIKHLPSDGHHTLELFPRVNHTFDGMIDVVGDKIADFFTKYLPLENYHK